MCARTLRMYVCTYILKSVFNSASFKVLDVVRIVGIARVSRSSSVGNPQCA